jgi:putative ABC transport system permease protein
MRFNGDAGMTALHSKLFRELWQQGSQMLSIAAVVAVGVMTVLTLRGSYQSLVAARDTYYRDTRFPDVWASLERAPESLRRRIESIPGVAVVNTRVAFSATLDVPHQAGPGLGAFVSIPDDRNAMLAKLHVVSGRYASAETRDEAVVSKKFAIANGFRIGDTLRAVINGHRRDLQIVGTAISPEYTYAVPPGALYPDDERFGIVWMNRRVLGPAYDMNGSFNQLVLTLAPRADRDRVIAELDRLLAPYGGRGAYGREHQASHQLVNSELESDRTLGTAIPVVFLLVAAFLLNIVLGRMIATQRTDIAVLKAFGYSNLEVGAHYVCFAMAAVLVGSLAGIGMGILTGRGMIAVYRGYFDFPTLRYGVSWSLIAVSAGVSAVAAGVGAAGAVRQAVALPPAEAMRPQAPASFRAGLVERLGIGGALPSSARMVLRNIERQPLRSLLSSIGVAFAVAILIVGLFLFDGIDYMMDLQFRVAQREDLSLTFNQPLPLSVRHDLANLRGVTRVEPFRSVPVRIRAGHRSREALITGMEPEARLRRIVTAEGHTLALPPEGLVVSSMLAEELGTSAGSTVVVEVLDGQRRSARVPVTAVIDDFMGISVYMDFEALHRLTRGGRSVSGAYLAVNPAARAALNDRLKRLPVVAGVASPAQMLKSFNEQLAQNLFVAVFFILGFSAVISIAVIYNGARIALSERGRELASLRVLGFSRREVAVLLLGEQGLTTVLGIPLGWALGRALAAAVSAGLRTETYRIPLVVNLSTFAWAAVITATAAILSGWMVRRRLDRMNLIDVLKTRE